jgi:uncharacterized protein (TIGR02996 family)
MSDEEALFRAICERPDDDALRLAYADCLQETGEPAKVARAEFIRLQCRRWSRIDDAQARDLARRRERNLLKRWRSAWCAGMPAALKRARFVRGFPRPEMKPTPQKFLSLTEADLAGAPRWHLDIDWLDDPRFPAAMASPLLARFDLAYLSVPYGRGTPADHVRALAASPYTRSLRVLHIQMPYDGGGLRELTASESLAGLTSLLPRGNHLGPDALRLLVGATFAPNLDTLTIQEGQLTPDAADVLASGARLPRLRSLTLHPRYYPQAQPADRTALLALFRSEFLRGVRILTIDATGMNDEAARAIAESPTLDELTFLGLSDNSLGEAGALALAASPGLGKLRTLLLYRCPCARSAPAMDALRARFPEVKA